MLRVVRRPSWIALTAVVILACVAFVELGMWQLRRHEARAADNAVIEANTARPAVDITVALLDDTPLATSDEWRLVEATGTFDVEQQMLVRGRTYDNSLGYQVLTPFLLDSGGAVLVARGWVPYGLDAVTAPEVPPPPTGTVTIEARLRPSEGTDAGTEGLPEGQVRRIAVPMVAATLPYPVLESGYAALVPGSPGSDQGSAGPRASELPEPDAGPHLAYAVQWFLFIGIAIGGWFVLLRSAARDERALTAAHAQADARRLASSPPAEPPTEPPAEPPVQRHASSAAAER